MSLSAWNESRRAKNTLGIPSPAITVPIKQMSSTPIKESRVPVVPGHMFAPSNDMELVQMLKKAPKMAESRRVGAMKPDDKMMAQMMKPQRLRSFTDDVPKLAAAMMNTWTNSVMTRRNYFEVADETRRIHLADTILTLVCDDAMNPDADGLVIELVSETTELQEQLDYLYKEFNLDNLITDIVDELVDYGERPVKLEVDPEKKLGLLDIDTNVNMLGIVALYEQGVPTGYMVLNAETQDYYILPPHDYAHFVMGSHKILVKLEDEMDPTVQIDKQNLSVEVADKIPEYVRAGKPFFWGCTTKIRELAILEQLIPALKLAQITASKLVALKLPGAMSPDDIDDALRQIEETLNTQTGIDMDMGQITLAEVINVAGRNKAVPVFGDGKGELEALNIRDDRTVDDILKALIDLRMMILSNVGIPYSLLFGPPPGQTGTGGGDNKASELRQFGRYTRKLGQIQRAIKQGLQQIVMAHCRNLEGFEWVTRDHFQVKFRNQMVDLSGLEKMEYDDAKQEYVSRKVALLQTMFGVEWTQQFLQKHIDEIGILEWLTGALNDLTGDIPLLNFATGDDDGTPNAELKTQVVMSVRDRFAAIRAKRIAKLKGKHPQHGELVGSIRDRFADLQGVETPGDDQPLHPQHHDVIDSIAGNFADKRGVTRDTTDDDDDSKYDWLDGDGPLTGKQAALLTRIQKRFMSHRGIES